MVKGSFSWWCSNWVCTDGSKWYQRSLFSVTLGKPLFFCFLCLARRNLTAIEAGIPGNARERGVCALGFALGPDNFCSNKTARVLSAVQTSCLFAGRNFQGILDDCVTQIWTICWMALYTDSPASRRSGLAAFRMLPGPPFGEEARPGDKQMVGFVPFSSQKVWMLKSKHFLCQRPVLKPVISLLA